MKKIIAFLAAATLSLQMFAGALVPAAATTSTGLKVPVKIDNPSLPADAILPADNFLPTGGIDSEANLSEWVSSTAGFSYTWVPDGNGGGYIESGIFPNESTGIYYYPETDVPAGTYKLTFYVRTSYEGHLSRMCVMVEDESGSVYASGADGDNSYRFMNVNISNEWTKAEFYFKTKAPIDRLIFRPTTYPTDWLTPFCVDQISLVAVDESELAGKPYMVGTNWGNKAIYDSQENLALLNENLNKELWDLEEAEKYAVDGLMLNLDNTSHGIGAVTCDQDVVDWANQFRGTHITDMIMNIAESKCVYPTDVFFGWYGDPTISDYTDGKFTYESNSDNQYVLHFETRGLDYLKTLTTALPDAGINMWLSIRMNDNHDRGKAYSSLFSEYYFEHPEFRRVQYTNLTGVGYTNVWDYYYPEIRQKFLALLNESLDRYDVYGYQYEFQREIRLFHIGGEYAGVDIMNDFMRKTAEIVDIYEEKYGHKIKFSVQVAPDLQTNYDFGLDVMAWVGEGLVDMVSPKGRHGTTHNEMPLAMWKTMLEPFGVELAPDIEHRVNGNANLPAQNEQKVDLTLHNIETYAGTAALYYSQGADKIQLYNLLVDMGHQFKEFDKISEFDPEIVIPEVSSGYKSVPAWWLVFAHIGSYERLMTMTRSVLLTYKEVYAPWKTTDYKLQATLLNGKTSVFRIGMGDIPAGATVKLRFAAAGASAANAPTVYVNSEKCNFVGIEESPSLLRTTNNMYCYEIPVSAHGDMYAVAEITPTSGNVTVDYMDIYITPAK